MHGCVCVCVSVPWECARVFYGFTFLYTKQQSIAMIRACRCKAKRICIAAAYTSKCVPHTSTEHTHTLPFIVDGVNWFTDQNRKFFNNR